MKVRYCRNAPNCYVEAWVSYGGQRAPRINTTDKNLRVVFAREPREGGKYCYVFFRGAWRVDGVSPAKLRRRAKAGQEEFIDARSALDFIHAAIAPSMPSPVPSPDHD